MLMQSRYFCPEKTVSYTSKRKSISLIVDLTGTERSVSHVTPAEHIFSRIIPMNITTAHGVYMLIVLSQPSQADDTT